MARESRCTRRGGCPPFDAEPHALVTVMRAHRVILIVLLLLNAVVLLGQLWPEGAPPFARAVNIAFLSASFVYFARALLRRAP